MLRLEKVAITGGIGCGKTTVGRLLEKQGAYLVNADAIVHRLLTENRDVIEKVVQIFGEGIIENGVINRRKVAAIAFEDRKKLDALEDVLHPLVYEDIVEASTVHDPKYRFFAAEIPLLFESKNAYDFDHIIAVNTKREQAIKRSGFTEKEYDLRMARHLNPDEKAKRASFVINNNQDLNALETAVKEFVQTCLKKKPR